LIYRISRVLTHTPLFPSACSPEENAGKNPRKMFEGKADYASVALIELYNEEIILSTL
jgi:hypothetical protein